VRQVRLDELVFVVDNKEKCRRPCRVGAVGGGKKGLTVLLLCYEKGFTTE
jgi:hypothetical protein